MKNMKTIINNHNSRILDEKRSVNSRACNCRDKSKIYIQIYKYYININIIYNKLIRYNQPHTQDKVCFGIVETYFKSYANHLQSFNDRYEEKDTESSNEFWLKASIGFFWK